MTAPRFALPDLAAFCETALAAAGADEETAAAATRAMMHATTHGVDSHGVRLLGHYVKALRGGRVNGTPVLTFRRTRAATGMLDADHAHGARATYAAVGHAADLAAESGVGAAGIRNTSHFGPAGAYSLAAAERGLIGLVFGNSDSFVRLHGGAARFHGTNPISLAVPSGEERPWLLDMATSAIPLNRIELYASLGRRLPDGVASDREGRDTTDPGAVEMLAPLGGEFGFKGAGLAGMAGIFSAVLTGMRLDHEIPPMGGPDFETPRGMGAFVMVLDPEAFAGADAVRDGMIRYLSALRGGATAPGAMVMAPGDREWTEAERRRRQGVTIDPATAAAFDELSARYDLDPPRAI